MVQERITDTDTSDSSDCCDVNISSHFSHDSQNRNAAASASVSGNSIIFKCEDSGSGRNSTSFPSTPNSQCASPLIIMSESSSSSSTSSNSNNNNVTITSDEDSRSRSNTVNVPSNSNSNIPSVNNKYNVGINKNHRNKSKPKSINYDNICPIPSPSMTNNNNTHENNVKNTSSGTGTGSSGPGNARKLSEPQVENVPPTGIVVPRTVPCIVLTPPSLFSPSTGVPLFPFDHMQSGKIPPTDFTSATTVSIRCAPNNNSAAPGPETGTTSAFSSAFQLNNLIDKNNISHHDGLKFKIENSLNLSQSCSNNNNSNNNNSVKKDDGKPRPGTCTGEGAEPPKKLSFGIDQILAGEKEKGTRGFNRDLSPEPRIPIGSTSMSIGHPMEIDYNLKSYNTPPASHHHNNTTTSNNNGVVSISNDEERMSTGGNYPSQCSECFFLSRYCRRIQFPTTTPTSASTSFTWIPSQSSGVHPVDSGPSSLLSTTGYSHHQHVGLSSYGLTGTNFSNMPTMVSCNTSGNGRRKRSWSRAVFSNLQRKGLEKRFQLQKYITKPDRRQLAATLGLTDAQVKVWFQNRRMKWRHSKEGKQGTHIPDETIIVNVDKK